MSVKLHLGRAFYQGLEIKLISRAQTRADLCLLMTRLPAGMSAPRAVSPSSPLLLQQKPSRGPGGLFFVQPLCTSPQRWTWVDLDTSEVCCSARQVARGFPLCVDPKASHEHSRPARGHPSLHSYSIQPWFRFCLLILQDFFVEVFSKE